jgi:rhamnosyltransferase subunit B
LRYIASAFGSAGDFLPTLAVAHELARAGHDVSFVTNAFHERAVRAAGLDYVGAGDPIDLYGIITADPELLTSVRVLGIMWEDLARPHFTATYHLVHEMLRRERVDAVIGSNLAWGLLWAASARNVPAAMIAATPTMWTSRSAPTQLFDFELPGWSLALVNGVMRGLVVGGIDYALRSIARSAGAMTYDPSLSGIERRVALHAGMWPELMRPSSPSDLANMRACGFVRAGHLGTPTPLLSTELEAFLAAGDPPVVIALGSIFSLGSNELVRDAALAARDVDRRCIVVGGAPEDLPAGTLVVPYATYHLLFPRAAAIVGHGGAGTTAEALRSGRPSIVVPLAFDQFAIGWQVERLGAGVRVRKSGRTRETIAAALRTALEDETIAARATDVAAELEHAPDGAAFTAKLITELGEAST